MTQKGQSLTSSGSIKIDCSAMQSGDICGLGMLGDPRGFIAVTKDPKRIIMSEEEVVMATVNNITANVLYFRIEMNFSNKQAKFFWKDDSTKSWSPLGTTITMGYDWQHGTFQGEQYAILCFNTGASSGYMDVDYFRLNDQPGPGTIAIRETLTPVSPFKSDKFIASIANRKINITPVDLQMKYGITLFTPHGQLITRKHNITGIASVPIQSSGAYIINIDHNGGSECKVLSFTKL